MCSYNYTEAPSCVLSNMCNSYFPCLPSSFPRCLRISHIHTRHKESSNVSYVISAARKVAKNIDNESPKTFIKKKRKIMYTGAQFLRRL